MFLLGDNKRKLVNRWMDGTLQGVVHLILVETLFDMAVHIAFKGSKGAWWHSKLTMGSSRSTGIVALQLSLILSVQRWIHLRFVSCGY